MIKSVLVGDMKHYEEIFGFSLPDDKKSIILDPVDITLKKYRLTPVTTKLIYI